MGLKWVLWMVDIVDQVDDVDMDMVDNDSLKCLMFSSTWPRCPCPLGPQSPLGPRPPSTYPLSPPHNSIIIITFRHQVNQSHQTVASASFLNRAASFSFPLRLKIMLALEKQSERMSS